jgi:hypothetical protein
MATLRSDAVASVTSAPLSRTRPSVGRSSPAMIRSVVDLPQPDGPRIEVNEPSGTASETSCSTGVAPNRRVTPSSSIIARPPLAHVRHPARIGEMYQFHDASASASRASASLATAASTLSAGSSPASSGAPSSPITRRPKCRP